MRNLIVAPKTVIDNPDAKELKRLTAQMPTARETVFGNLNVSTKVVSRSKGSTFVVDDDASRHSDQTIGRSEYDRWAKIQDDHVRGKDMIVIDGYIGNDPAFRTRARLIMEREHANIAGMQQRLYYPAEDLRSWEPEVTVVYTPTLEAKGYPSDRLIAVDLENNVTRVFNSDYFGESKKGGLRMWNKLVHDRGGLALHAGCKVIPVRNGKRVGLIVGLSGTGKTTTTFTRQNDSQPVQDDFCALLPKGRVYATENGCFAKTFGLDPRYEPTIHRAVCHPDAYLENVSINGKGEPDFFDTSYTPNGRAVFGMKEVEGAADARSIEKVDFLLILNRNENIIPAVARLEGALAAAYFMLGETKGTSAGGAEEAGKSLRVPGTNPFFPLLHSMQGNRFLELWSKDPFEVYLMNTGRVGGPDGESRSKKVKIPHSSAVVKGIAEGTIQWKSDPDFGYSVATSVPEFPGEDAELLEPRKMYEAQGRREEYEHQVARLRRERLEYLRKWPGLSADILKAMS